MSRHYELVLMIDPETGDAERDKLAADVRGQIEQAGTLDRADDWGMRKLAYEIRQRTEADYRFFRFQTESPLLDELDHNLKITDGVLRFRIFKVDPASPVIEPPPPVSLAGSGPSRGPGARRGRGRGRDEYEDRAPDPGPPTAASAPAAAAATAPAAEPAPAEPAAKQPAESSTPAE